MVRFVISKRKVYIHSHIEVRLFKDLLMLSLGMLITGWFDNTQDSNVF